MRYALAALFTLIGPVAAAQDPMTRSDIPTLLPGESIVQIGGPTDCQDDNGPGQCRDLEFEIVCGIPAFMADPSRGPITSSLTVRRRLAKPGTARVGHITFQVGGFSKVFYAKPLNDPDGVDYPNPLAGGRRTIKVMRAKGYDTYELAFQGALGPWTGAAKAGYIEPDCATAVIIKYIDHEYVDSGEAMCATGNSHGGFAVMHGLYRKQLAGVLDGVVFSGGPYPRWDLQAFGTKGAGGAVDAPDTGPNAASPAAHQSFHGWGAGRQRNSTDYLHFSTEWKECNDPTTTGPACRTARAYRSAGPPLPVDVPTQSQIDMVRRVSSIPTGPHDRYEFPNLAVGFVVGSEDATNAQNQAWLYHRHIAAGRGQMFHTVTEANGLHVLNQDHKVHGIYLTHSGSQKIIEYLLRTCKDWPRP